MLILTESSMKWLADMKNTTNYSMQVQKKPEHYSTESYMQRNKTLTQDKNFQNWKLCNKQEILT
jgi:hypothetical protein